MHFFIYLIAFLEGFTTLSIEIIAIRRFSPIIGINSISTSIILGVILLALSYGYYVGGKKSVNREKIVDKIIINLSISSLYYMIFTFIFDTHLIVGLLHMTKSYVLSLLFASFLLFFIPIFLASQTIPLLSELLKGNNAGEKIGKLLFFSTIGSFLGSLLTSSLFFGLIGVEKTATLNSVILSSIAFLMILLYHKFNPQNIQKYLFPIAVLALSFAIIFHKTDEKYIFSKANSYHNIDIYETSEGNIIFSQNGGYSSGINKKTKESFFEYIKEIKQRVLENKYENILVIGAAGFTLPYELSREAHIKNIDVVDIDGELKNITEMYFLQEPLSEKINFIVEPSRYFLYKKTQNTSGKKYDAVIVDVYLGKSLPAQTLTYEFFRDIKIIGNDVYLNIITDRHLSSDFSKKLLSTITKSFGQTYYKIVNNNILEPKKNILTNMIITNTKHQSFKKYLSPGTDIYTDNKHSIELDLFTRDTHIGGY